MFFSLHCNQLLLVFLFCRIYDLYVLVLLWLSQLLPFGLLTMNILDILYFIPLLKFFFFLPHDMKLESISLSFYYSYLWENKLSLIQSLKEGLLWISQNFNAGGSETFRNKSLSQGRRRWPWVSHHSPLAIICALILPSVSLTLLFFHLSISS